MIESLVSVVGQRGVDAAAFLLAFALTALTDSLFHNKLPHDHGREFAVNGGLSKGKARGSGLIFVLCIALVSLAFLPFRVEYVIYTVLLIASMLSGYFDDAAEKAWNEYKKGIIDFVIAVVAGVTYLNFNGCGVQFLQWSFTLPYAVYLLLIVILIWASINVVNCTDGVDGLSASLAVVTIGTYLIAYHEELADYSTAGVVFMGALLAYLWSNAKPSTLLMGDAGSRAMGFFIAILSPAPRCTTMCVRTRAGATSRSWPAGSSCSAWHRLCCCSWCTADKPSQKQKQRLTEISNRQALLLHPKIVVTARPFWRRPAPHGPPAPRWSRCPHRPARG